MTHRMPYTEAFIMETHRLACLVPFAVPHVAVEEAEVAGYRFPKVISYFSIVISRMCSNTQRTTYTFPKDRLYSNHSWASWCCTSWVRSAEVVVHAPIDL